MSVRARTWQALDVGPGGNGTGRLLGLFIASLIVLNLAAIVLESVHSVSHQRRWIFWDFEVFSVLVFTVEYLGRVWSCVTDERYRHPVWGRLRFMATPMAVIDLCAVLPFYLPFVWVDLRFLRAARLTRLLRIAKLGRYSRALQTVGKVIMTRKEELLSATTLVALLLVVSSCVLYFAENKAQPEKFSSIPATMWWAVCTLLTVGYGDIYPVTGVGKFLGSVVALLGIAAFALPTAILGAGFVEELNADRRRPDKCPHCGGRLE